MSEGSAWIPEVTIGLDLSDRHSTLSPMGEFCVS